MSAGLTDTGPPAARRSGLLAGLAAVTVAGLLVRAIPVFLATDFPVNDGGLFVAMTRAIQDAGWALPQTVAWNGADLPFAYPPLAFYAAGIIESALGVDLLGVFRWLPLAASTLVVPAVYLLGRELLRSELGGLVAALAYALAPVSFVWLVQGGGVTRAPGMLLAVLALWQLLLLVREPTSRRVMVVGGLSGLTVLVHPSAAVFLALSGLLLWAFEGRNRRSFTSAAIAAGIALVIASPWLFLALTRHGVGVLLDVPSNGPDPAAAILAVFAGRYTGAPFIDPLAVIGLAFAILSLIRRRFLLAIWFAVSLLLSYQFAMVPFGLLIGVAAVDLAGLRERGSTAAEGSVRWVPRIGMAVLAIAIGVEALAGATAVLDPSAPLHALSHPRRDAMDWVTIELPPDARVAVVTTSEWSGDPDSEWFPLLTGRLSVATVQGSEWLGTDAFNNQVQAHRALQACVGPASISCVEDWLADWPADYLYLPKGPLHGSSSPDDCCADLRALLSADADFEPMFDGPGATILAVVD